MTKQESWERAWRASRAAAEAMALERIRVRPPHDRGAAKVLRQAMERELGL